MLLKGSMASADAPMQLAKVIGKFYVWQITMHQPNGHGLKLKYPRRNTASASKNFFQSCFMFRVSSERSGQITPSARN
jgi:hypothetical protein